MKDYLISRHHIFTIYASHQAIKNIVAIMKKLRVLKEYILEYDASLKPLDIFHTITTSQVQEESVKG